VVGCEHGGVERPDTRKLWNANAAAWAELSRAGFDVYRDLVNTPAFFAVLPPVDGLLCLDLGCGEGHNTRLLAARGARVVALDVAELFIAAAAERERRGIRYLLGDGALLPFGGSGFDAVTAFMSLMDVADPERTLLEVARVLRPGGFVQFSVVHPVMSAPVGRWVNDDQGVRQGRVIGDYFYQGPLTETWSFSALPAHVRDRHQPFTITYARRTLTGWLSAVLAADLIIEAVAEPHADEQTAATHPEVADTRIAPYCLIVRARKP
jgi:ubiquinone/menaquinone biosynthesis C-methylase UbiE